MGSGDGYVPLEKVSSSISKDTPRQLSLNFNDSSATSRFNDDFSHCFEGGAQDQQGKAENDFFSSLLDFSSDSFDRLLKESGDEYVPLENVMDMDMDMLMNPLSEPHPEKVVERDHPHYKV